MRNLKDLLVDTSKLVVEMTADFVCKNPEYYKPLILLAFEDKDIFSNRAAISLSKCQDINPNLCKPYLSEIIQRLPNFKIDGIKRSFLKIFITEYSVIISDEDLFGSLVNICFDFVNSPNETVAVKVYSLYILNEIAVLEPDLKNELRLVIEEQIPHAQKAFISVGKKILKNL